MSKIDLTQITGPASGFKDYFGTDAANRTRMIREITNIFRLYGAEQLDTPVIERNETLRGKGGNESEKLIYNVQDLTGENTLGLRFDLTVPLARFCAQNSGNIQYPLMRYAYGDVFRGETASSKKGRLRGFMQCDLDIVGSSSFDSDLKILLIMDRVMKHFGLDYVIRVNNRLVLDALAETLNITDNKSKNLLFSIVDEIEKIDEEEFKNRVVKNFSNEVYNTVNSFLQIQGDSITKLNSLKKIFVNNSLFEAGAYNLEYIFGCITKLGLDKNIIFDQSIVRGLDYYTGIIYETNLLNYKELGSVFSGGRYDKLIEKLGGPNLPSVGTSVGVDRLLTALVDSNYFKSVEKDNKIYVAIMANDYLVESLRVAEDLRNNGYVVIMPENSAAKLKKQFSDSSELGCSFTIVIGEEEIKLNSVSVKNMQTTEQNMIELNNLLAYLDKYFT